MHMKYGRRGDFIPRFPDSPIWKLICRMHPAGMSHTTGDAQFLSWTPSPTGEFTLKSAYNICRTSVSAQLSSKFIWFKHHSPSTKLLLWRIFNSALPFEDYLGHYAVIRPTQCPFCRHASASIAHVFMYCECISPIWAFFSSELQVALPTPSTLRQYLLSWWFRSSESSLAGVLKIIVPALIVLNIWKHYAQLIYGDSKSFSTTQLRHAIYFDINIWIHKVQGTKLTAGPPISLSWIPRIRSPRLKVVRWKCPPSGRFKLNVDAAVGARYAAGGALLRNHHGECVRAISFRLPCCTPLLAEIQATFFGL